jgi:tetratricopeptide (TPR) repeat protein
LFRQTDDRWSEGATLGNIGAISFSAGRFTEAIEYYQQDLAVRETTGNLSGIGLTLANISYAYEALGRMPECLDYAQRALDSFRRTGDRRGEGVVLGTVAWAYLRVADDPTTALSYARQALAIDREVRDRRNEMCVVDTIGLIYRELGDYETALEHLHQALAMALELGSNMFEDEFRTNILDTYLLTTKVDK